MLAESQTLYSVIKFQCNRQLDTKCDKES